MLYIVVFYTLHYSKGLGGKAVNGALESNRKEPRLACLKSVDFFHQSTASKWRLLKNLLIYLLISEKYILTSVLQVAVLSSTFSLFIQYKLK